MVKTTNSGHQSFTFVLFCWLLAENFKKSAEKNTYEVFMTGGSVFSEPPCTLDCTITDNTFSVSWKIGYTESHNYILLSFYSISITDYNGLESFLTKFSMMVCSTHSLLLMGLQGYFYIRILHHTKIMHGWHSFIDGRDLKDRNSRRVETRLNMLFTPKLPFKAT